MHLDFRARGGGGELARIREHRPVCSLHVRSITRKLPGVHERGN